jgi:hypothetical protein
MESWEYAHLPAVLSSSYIPEGENPDRNFWDLLETARSKHMMMT